MDKNPDVAAQLDVLRMRVLADAESQNYLKDKEPTDAELHAEYDTAVATMDKTEYHAEHILVPSKEAGRGRSSRRSKAARNLKMSPRRNPPTAPRPTAVIWAGSRWRAWPSHSARP